MSERNLDARVAVLEEIAAATRQTLQEIRDDIRELHGELNRRLDRVDGQMCRNFHWLLGITLGGFVALLGTMAHGFHWL